MDGRIPTTEASLRGEDAPRRGRMAVLTEIKKQVPGVLVLLAGLLWAALIWRNYDYYTVAPGNVNAEVVMQYYDCSLRLDICGADWCRRLLPDASDGFAKIGDRTARPHQPHHHA